MYSNGTEVKIVTHNVFGDGNHETTQLVLDLLYKHEPKNKDVLDIGTGTGIQSIFAKKWGAANVLAVDIEYTAIFTARANFKRNDVEVKSRLNILNEDLDFKADIIVANLPAHALREFLPVATDSMKSNAILICSWPKQFNLINECDLTHYIIADKLEGLEYDGYVFKEKK